MNLTIRRWEDDDAGDYIDLSIAWLKKYNLLEPADFRILYHPHEVILNQGGEIFFAAADGINVGTVSMIPMENGIYEMAKLTVREDYRRLHIGDALVREAIQFAKSHGGRKVILFTNSRLIPAIALYRKHGFKMVPHTDCEYEVSDSKMVLML